uniref:RNA-directed DNA polymerase, eukaryota, reverse transcriptase zinc-binding domain protein n=1 Tax=Tanacetum cinerariifolium TaxID=118510 RepID=A0A6L2JHV4_TANCI|nr:hypothetical protein [Tanacetum cinerariifolium]
MTTVNQGMSVEEIKWVVAQRVANAIEAIAIYETKTNLAHKSMSQTERQEEKVAENASNKRKWECNYNGSLSQQNKGHKAVHCKVRKLQEEGRYKRCLKKAGKIDFARVLVEVSAEDDLPNVLEIEYPPLGNRPSRIGMLEVKYQWRPPLCTHCKTFGHSTLSCKIRPRTDDEISTNTIKEAINVNSSGVTDSSADLNEGVDNGRRQLVENQKQYGNGQKKNSKLNAGTGFAQGNVGKKPLYQYRNDPNFSCNDGDDTDDMGGINVNDEFESKVWPELKEEVDILMEASIYPSKQVRMDWSIHQMDYFYKNCHKFHLDPIIEDDEGDVESDVEGIAMDMKLKFDVNDVNKSEINTATFFVVFLRLMFKRGTYLRSVIVFLVIGVRLLTAPLVLLDKPWTILDDFNACLDPSERSRGSSKFTTAVADFRDCVEDIEVEDIAMTGLRFTWNKKPGREGGLLKKLDRVMGNSSFVSSFPSSFAHFLPYMLSDHSPAVIAIPKIASVKAKPFKFHNFLTTKDDFIPVVKRVWSNKVEGFAMFGLVSKLKLLKKPLRKLCFEQGNLYDNVKKLKSEFAAVQSAMDVDPHNNSLRSEELRVLKDYKTALKDEESFLRQKSKVEWLNVGDRNSKYFHNVVKGKCNRNRISYVEDMEGNPFHGNSVGDQFVRHLKSVLGKCSKGCPIKDPSGMFLKMLSGPNALYMVRRVSDEEIKMALFDIDGNKAPGPDGGFFLNGKLLKEVNATVISLVPKIKGSLNDLVDVNQSAFIPSRQISDNILLSQELMRNYHRSRGHAKCAFKIDIEKANAWVKAGRSAIFVPVYSRYGSPEFDDLLLFCNGDSKSVSVMKKALSEFLGMSGLLPNCSKSTVFFGNDCHVLIDKAWKRILDWKNKSLSFAGRLQLIRMIASSGLNLQSKVANVIKNGEWNWPVNLSNTFDALNVISPPCISEGKNDKVVWKSCNGGLLDFSMSNVWENIRMHGALVS